MEAFLAALMESFKGGAAPLDEAVASGGMAVPSAAESLGSTIGGIGNQAVAPVMDAYKTFTNPNASAGDMLSGAYKYAFKNKEDEQMMSAPQMRMGGGMGGMGSNYVGGIPSLLQGYGGASQGILPYIAGR